MSRHVETRSAFGALLAVSLFLVGLPATATVSGENGKIAFVSDRDGNPEIYVMEADGSNPVNLTNHPGSDSSPAWSPDGRQLAFVSDRDGGPAIYVMEADGSEVTLLTSGEDPAWSPDGTRIALSRDGAIFIRSLSGGETRITDPSTATHPTWARTFLDRYPAWSPDGSSIAFKRDSSGGTPTASFAQLLVTDATTLRTPTVLPSSSWNLHPPDWSPDGKRIVIGEIAIHNLLVETVLVAADGSGVVRLPVPDGFDRSEFPTWSPDGRVIASSMGLINRIPLDVYTMNPDGSNAIKITNLGGYDPAWQPLNPYPIGLVDPAAGMWHLRHEDGRVASFFFGDPGDFPFLGDWDCDGIETPGLYRQSDGFVFLRNSNTQGIADIRFFFGNPGDIPIAGDFDGDGCDTVSIYRPSEARIYVINELGANDGGSGAAEHSYLFGDLGDKPFVGDLDGDGADTVGLHRESTGMVYYRDSNTQGVAENTFIYGDPGDRLLGYDWNGDGRDSPAVFRPGNHTVYFRLFNSSGGADARYIWRAPRLVAGGG